MDASVSSTSVSPRSNHRRYDGLSQEVSITSPIRAGAIRMALEAVKDIEPLAKGNTKWVQLKNEMVDVMSLLSDPDRPLPLYKLQILADAVCPYISIMKSRMILSGERLSQLLHVLEILDIPSTHHTHSLRGAHPAEVLLAVDAIVSSIDRTPSWYKSELSIKLNNAVSKQWQPILKPIRTDLQSIAVKLMFLSLIEIARPIVLAWPLFTVIREILFLLKALEEVREGRRGAVNTLAAGLQIAKAVILLLVVHQAVSFLNLLSGSGFMLGFIGVSLMILQANDTMLKPFVPVIAENLEPLMSLVDSLHAIERRVTGGEEGSEGHADAQAGRGLRTAYQQPSPAPLRMSQRQFVEQAAAKAAPTTDNFSRVRDNNSENGNNEIEEIVGIIGKVSAMYAPLVSYAYSAFAPVKGQEHGSGKESERHRPRFEVLADKDTAPSAPSETQCYDYSAVVEAELIDEAFTAHTDSADSGVYSEGIRRRKPQQHSTSP